MKLNWYRRDQQGVVEALKRGTRPTMATTMSCGPLDELIALHDELGVFDALGEVKCQRQRAGIEDELQLRTIAVLPFLEAGSLSGAAQQLFQEPAILLHLGWSPLQLQTGDNERHHCPQKLRRLPESLPCHPDTLRDALKRVSEAAWLQLQQAGVRGLFERHLVHGHVYAIDGTGLNDEWRLVCLVCVSAQRPVIVAWRLLSGEASEKGKEARVTRRLVEQAIARGGKGCIDLLLMDALYADGPLLAWLKYKQNIDAIVPIPSDRELHRDLVGLVEGGLLSFTSASYTCTRQGHKQRRTLEFAWQDGLTGWDSFVSAALGYGAVEPCLWGCLIRSPDAALDADKEVWTIVSTRAWRDGMAAWQGYRPRWHIENDAYRELKEGWRLESQRWGRDEAVQRGRITLTCLAFNTAQVYLSQAGAKLAARGIRRLRRLYQPELGAAPAVIYIGRSFAVLPLEELLAVLGRPATISLRSLNHPVRPP